MIISADGSSAGELPAAAAANSNGRLLPQNLTSSGQSLPATLTVDLKACHYLARYGRGEFIMDNMVPEGRTKGAACEINVPQIPAPPPPPPTRPLGANRLAKMRAPRMMSSFA